MQDTLITFETAKLAKEKGFLHSSTTYYSPEFGDVEKIKYCQTGSPLYWKLGTGKNDNRYSSNLIPEIAAPTQSLLQKWLREIHNIHIWINTTFQDNKIGYEAWVDVFKNNCFQEQQFDIEMYGKTYEEALEVGLQEALKLV
jgi:hypothetical protein